MKIKFGVICLAIGLTLVLTNQPPMVSQARSISYPTTKINTNENKALLDSLVNIVSQMDSLEAVNLRGITVIQDQQLQILID